MLVGKKTYYLIKVLLFFTFSEKQSFAIKEISKRVEVSEKILEQVLLLLKNNGILTSKRGPKGGYRLLKDTSAMSILDIIKISGTGVDFMPIEKDRTKFIDDVYLICQTK